MLPVSRRSFLQDSAALTSGVAAAGLGGLPSMGHASPAKPAARFQSEWHRVADRIWLGREYWANPLQDWRIAGGRMECINPGPDRNVHLLTRSLADRQGAFTMSVRLGRIGGRWGRGRGSAGFRIGIQGPIQDYRNSVIFGRGLDAGLTASGRLFIGDPRQHGVDFESARDAESLELRLEAVPLQGAYSLAIHVFDSESGQQLHGYTRDVPADRLVGNVALVVNFGPARPQGGEPGFGTGRFWFRDWKVEGEKIDAHEERGFGPILFSQYTLHDGVLKLTAQMPPMGEQDSQTVRLQLRDGDEWKTAAEASIHPEARTATFRIEGWDTTKEVPYRLIYALRWQGGDEQNHDWTGTIRRDPVDQPLLTVADISCNFHAAFPNAHYVANLAKLDPDLIAFTGDQFYESTGGYGVTRNPGDVATLDYLRKWYLHGWTWRELTRDRPSISIPDDHDVWQGNIWGEAGAPQETTQEAGGYQMPPEWVNVVHRTQTSHHPDPHDPTPVQRGISVYYGPLTYGRVSFAILADRQFKTGPEGVVPRQGPRGDHVTDENFDPQKVDVPGAELLGERQMAFLREWAADWRGAEMKAVISQTIFTAMATTHGQQRMRLRADYDTNGWPQTARNAALREIRKAFAVHIAGDQHLPAVVHYGIETHRDAGVAFAGPAVNVGYPRWWEPEQPGENRPPGTSELLGDFTDHFGHPLTVLAVKNGVERPSGQGVLQTLEEKASGLGIVRFDKSRRTITYECWPFLADPTRDEQFPGWPVTVSMFDNGRQPVGHLPTLEIHGAENAVVQVIEEASGEVVYTLRISGHTFRPPVFAPGHYTVRILDSEQGRERVLTGLEATVDEQGQRVHVEL